MYDRIKDNAHRLANVLNNYSNRNDIISIVANCLDYEPEQLAEDMKSIKKYIKRLEEKQNDRD